MTWHQINTRRISLQMCLFWNDGFNQKEFTTYGIGIKKFLNFFDGRKTEYYVTDEGWKKFRAGQEALLDDLRLVTTLPWEAQTFLENQLKAWKTIFPADLSKLSNPELTVWQKKIAEAVGWTNSRTWMIYLINDLIADRVRNKLIEKFGDAPTAEKYLLSFVTPLEMNEAMKERVALLELALEQPKLSITAFQEKLMAHTKRFCFIPMFGFDHDPYTITDFENELAGFTNPVAELAELKETIRARRETFERELRELKLTTADYLFRLIQMLKHTVFVRDYRDTLRQQMYLLDRGFYAEVGKRLGGLTVAQTTNLTSEEIIQGLSGQPDNLNDIVVERAAGFLVIDNDYHLTIFSGQAAHRQAQIELDRDNTNTVSELYGTNASPGVARGPARIIETNQDLQKIKPGDVMITHVTRQDFVPAMRRCAAIVTDEGGITNHAAIISREFGLPCIVGTKTAVTTFHDGELVEVNATKGTIRRAA